MSRADDEVHEALSDELARLTGNARFTVAEFTEHGVTIWRVYRDRNGTPLAEWRDLSDFGPAVLSDPDAFYRTLAPAFIVCTSPWLPDKLRDLLPGARDVPSYECPSPLEELIRAAIRESPLTLGYELAVLKPRTDGRPGTGQLMLTGHRLIPPGESQGFQVKVRVRSAPANGEGTVFAIVTREPRPGIAPNARALRPVQVESAVLAPGSYELTAVLSRPGRVRFEGLPVPLRKCGTSWDDLKHQVPEQLAAPEPVHLICLIEVCGGDQRLQPRIDRLEQLITAADASTGQLAVSVVAYGPHAVAWATDDEPAESHAWAAPGTAAIPRLRALAGREEDEREYTRAAQLECALQEVAMRLSERDGRPVLVTAGGRPAHPPGMDTHTQIIPCPNRVSWRLELNRLLRVPGITFGALRDRGARAPVWQVLGRDASATVDDAVDMADFAAALGLRDAAQVVPFPFLDE